MAWSNPLVSKTVSMVEEEEMVVVVAVAMAVALVVVVTFIMLILLCRECCGRSPRSSFNVTVDGFMCSHPFLLSDSPR
jgi:hypothetical protein